LDWVNNVRKDLYHLRWLVDVYERKDIKIGKQKLKKVCSYFEWKYPGNQKLDATGRSVR